MLQEKLNEPRPCGQMLDWLSSEFNALRAEILRLEFGDDFASLACAFDLALFDLAQLMTFAAGWDNYVGVVMLCLEAREQEAGAFRRWQDLRARLASLEVSVDAEAAAYAEYEAAALLRSRLEQQIDDSV